MGETMAKRVKPSAAMAEAKRRAKSYPNPGKIALQTADSLQAIRDHAKACELGLAARRLDVERTGAYARSSAMFNDRRIPFIRKDGTEGVRVVSDPRRILWMQDSNTKGGSKPHTDYKVTRSLFGDKTALTFKRGAIHKVTGSQLSTRYPGHNGLAFDANAINELRMEAAGHRIGLTDNADAPLALAKVLRKVYAANGDSYRVRIIRTLRRARKYGLDTSGYDESTVSAPKVHNMRPFKRKVKAK